MRRTTKQDPKPTTIKRKVYFYRVFAGVTETGELRQVNFGPALKHINGLPFSDAGRYLTTEDGKQLCCWVDNPRYPYRLRLANIRRSQHPPVESEGALTALILGRGKGLAELTHAVIFPDGICGAEFNFYGPRASALPFYFSIKATGILPSFRLNPLVRPDLQARLAKITDISLLDMKMRASYADTIAAADADLGAAFKATIQAVGAKASDELQLMFKRKKNRKLLERSVPARLLEAIQHLARRSDLRDEVSTFKLMGTTNGIASPFDILSEQFMAEAYASPALDLQGGVDTGSMFSEIERVHSDLRDMLAKASDLEEG